MLHKTKGIVLNYIKYSDTSIITRIYTEAFGLQSYIVNGVRSSKSNNKIALFQPLTLLDMVVYYKAQRGLQRISEMRCAEPYLSMPFNIHKTSIAIFLSEVLIKTLKEEAGNQELFDFLYHSFHALDKMEKGTLNFHVSFMLRYSFYLGFFPENIESVWQNSHYKPVDEVVTYMENCMKNTYFESFASTNVHRREALDLITGFYSSQIESFGEIHSTAILREVLE
ncbi:MAG: DNA repair protein RecO [Cytophagales bacterium]|nr:DNA repair protein RecO [Cytophaga sp.]